MARIEFNDGTARTLQSSVPAVARANRFSAWSPEARVIGPRRVFLASGLPHVTRVRNDNVATFEVRELKESEQETALRLQAHMRAGNSATLYTEDSAARTYTVSLAEGGDITISPPDRYMERVLSMTVVNHADAPMLATY